MTPEELNQEALKAFEKFRAAIKTPIDEETKKNFIKFYKIQKQKIPGKYVGSKSRTPYYRQEVGMWLKKSLDLLLENEGKDISFDSKKFLSISVNTLYMRIYWGWKWLEDFLDPDGLYKRLKKATHIYKEGHRISIRWKNNVYKTAAVTDSSPEAELIPQRKDSGNKEWRSRLLKFLDEAEEGQELEEVSLSLLSEEEEFIFDLCFDTEEFAIISMSKRGFKVICSKKHNEQWKESLR